MTITVTPQPANKPPRVGIAISLPVGSVMREVTVNRLEGTKAPEPIRQQPSAGFADRSVFDYEMPYETPISYEWTAEYLDGSAFTTERTETWANIAAWTAANGAGGAWSASGGNLIYTGPASSVAKITYSLAAARYRITLNTAPQGIDRIDLGGFYVDVVNRRLIVGTKSVTFDPGTGTWVINVTPTSVTITTTAGTYSIEAGVQVTKVEYVGPRVRTTISVGLISGVQGGFAFTPMAADTDTTGRLFVLAVRYVGPTAFYSVLIYSNAGAYLTRVDLTAGTGNGQYTSSPQGLAVDASNRLILGDYGGARIQRFTIGGSGAGTTLTYLDKVGTPGSGNGQFQTFDIQAIATDSTSAVYVVQINSHRVQKFTAALAYSTQWGSYGGANNQFYSPRAIAISGTSVYVADSGQAALNVLPRLRKFNLTGALQWQVGAAANFNDPVAALAVDSNGQVYAAVGRDIVGYNPTLGAQFMTIAGPTGSVKIRALAMDTTRTGMVAFERSANYAADYIALGGALIDDVTIESYGGIKTITETSSTVILEGVDGWIIHPGQPVLSVPLSYDDLERTTIEALGNVQQRSTAATHQILGRGKPIHVNTGPRQSDQTSLQIATETTADRQAVAALLADETPLLVRIPSSWLMDFDDGFYAVGDVTFERAQQMYGVPARIINLPLQSVEAPAVSVQNVGHSWATVASEIESWTAVRAVYATWADMLVDKRREGF